jgi:hypothetical protein
MLIYIEAKLKNTRPTKGGSSDELEIVDEPSPRTRKRNKKAQDESWKRAQQMTRYVARFFTYVLWMGRIVSILCLSLAIRQMRMQMCVLTTYLHFSAVSSVSSLSPPYI